MLSVSIISGLFDTYWKIPADCPTAIEGEWIEAPGYEVFEHLLKKYPDIEIVIEDLGDLRPGSRDTERSFWI